MKIPPNHSEDQVLAIIEKVVSQLAPSFTFGYYEVDDIKQEGRIFAIELLEKETYDPERQLENYVFTHVRNRMCNLKRNKFFRNEPPCVACHEGRACGPDGEVCRRYADWKKRNATKANLQRPMDIGRVSNDGERERRARVEPQAEQNAETAELLGRVDTALPLEFRADWLRMRAGVAVSRNRRSQIEDVIKEIVRWDENSDE